MRVEILKAVLVLGQVKRSGTFDVPDETAKHWIATGAAKAAVSPSSTSVLAPPPAGSGKKGL